MSFHQIKGYQIADQTVTRDDINTSVSGKSVISRILEQASSGVKIYSSTGADSGTGDVKLMVDTDYLDGIYLRSYTLPTASSSTLGGIKVGDGLDITGGTLSVTGIPGESSTGKFYATPPYPASGSPSFRAIYSVDLPALPVSKLSQDSPSTHISSVLLGSGTASGTTFLAGDNTWKVAYTLPTATSTTLGGVKTGSGNGLDSDLLDGEHGSYYLNYNNLYNTPSPYTLPIAGIGTLGGIKVGTGLTINGSGILSTNINAAIWNTIMVFGSYYMSSSDAAVVVNSSTSTTVYLPSNPVIGRLVAILKVQSISLTIDGNGEQITFKDDTPTTSFLAAWAHWMLFDGVYWRRIADNL